MIRLVTVAALLTAIIPAGPAAARTTDRDKVLAGWTRPTAASAAAWNAARLDRKRWAAYRFDWSTDLCTRAPENPFGFDFTNACRRHDFGYRNYRTDFARHKKRVDESFRADLRRICDARRLSAQPLCNVTAFAYFEAVRLLPRDPDLVRPAPPTTASSMSRHVRTR